MYFDAHLHLIDENELTKAHNQKINGFILNATQENEWEKIIHLSKKHPFCYASIGIHPWFIDSIKSGWEQRMDLFLKNNPFLMIGEIGLDGTKKKKEKQTEIFLKSLILAKKYQRPVHIHAVKSWNEILFHIKNFQNLTFLFHRFKGSNEIVQELKKYDVWYSLNSTKTIDYLPKNKILTETDCSSSIYPVKKLTELVDNFFISKVDLEQNFNNFIKKIRSPQNDK